MSLYSAMRAGVSGLFSQSQSMAMISDNIANVSTNGYKLVRSSFSSLITIQGTNGAYTAGSVRALPKRSIDVAGSLSSSNNPLDLSIVGEGFFAVTDRLENPSGAAGRGQYYTPASEILYSRNGEFRRDANGNLRNPAGYYLLGWPVTGTNSDGETTYDRTNLPSTLTAVSVQATTGKPTPSKFLTLNANINSEQITSGEAFPVTMNIFDRQGSLKTLRITFTPDPGITLGTGVNAFTEAYAYKVTMAFEGDNPPNFRNGLTTSSEFIAAFDSVGNFKSFYQVASGNPVNYAGARDPNGKYNAALATPYGGTNNFIPPLPPRASASRAFLLPDVKLGLHDSTNQESWYDLGVVESTAAGGVQTAITGTVPGNNERPDLRILGVEPQPGLQQFSTVAGAATPDVSYGTTVIFDVDFGKDGFQFQGDTVDKTAFPSAVYDNDVQLSLNFGAVGTQDGLTHYNAPNSITNITQDGQTIGQLEGVQISEEGIVTAVYDNGDRKSIAQVPVVSVNSPNNLEVANGNAFRASQASGDPVVRFPGTSGVGTIAPSTVETSNVDIAEEFTHMIITQRAYSASTKIITTADEMLDELIRAKR